MRLSLGLTRNIAPPYIQNTDSCPATSHWLPAQLLGQPKMRQHSQVQMERLDKSSAEKASQGGETQSSARTSHSTAPWNSKAAKDAGKDSHCQGSPGAGLRQRDGPWSVCSWMIPTSSPLLPFFPCTLEPPLRKNSKLWILAIYQTRWQVLQMYRFI